MLALRLTRGAHLAVQLRRLLVAAASAGTGFLLLSALGYAISHPEAPGAAALRLAWCAAPLAASVQFAVAVARTDPGTRPRTGLSAIGLGPGRLMAVSATTTALSCTLGSMLALLFFLHLRGDLTGLPIDGAAPDTLGSGRPLPLPAALTLLALVPLTASAAVALLLRPREPRPARGDDRTPRYGRFGAYGLAARETFGAYGRFGRFGARKDTGAAGSRTAGAAEPAAGRTAGRADTAGSRTAGRTDAVASGTAGATEPAASRTAGATEHVGSRTGATARVGPGDPPAEGGTLSAQASETHAPAEADGIPGTPVPLPRRQPLSALPWGIAVLAAGLAAETYSSRTTAADATPAAGVLIGWALTALGLALAGPGLTHLCGRLLQAARPGALRLLAGRVLMEEATRIGRPLGVVCAVASAAYAATTVYAADGPTFGPLSTLGALLVAGCAVATLLTAAVEAKHARADTTAALLRLGAPAGMLRGAAALRAGALLALFGPLTLAVAELAALPLAVA
ncbi:hypothetical protein [Streptomyces poriticola]|uniref:hypothetical protein n=1 Tax=Streptomyces poriticola TaxID=3120506 RepID=UPI002FCE1762